MKEKNKIIILLIAALLFSFGFTVILKWIQHAEIFNLSTIIFTSTNFLSVVSVAALFIKIISDNSKKSVIELKKRIFPSLIFFAVATIFITLSLFVAGLYILFLLNGWDTSQFINHLLQSELSGAFKSIAIGLFVSSIIFFYKIWSQAINREQKLREENLKYKYQNLKAQVNPHFLFNSLNTISDLIYTDPEKADSYIQKLSGIYRYILENEEIELIGLKEEIDFVKQYFELQKERTGNKVELNINIKDIDRFKIIPVSLQILVENALKHNSMSDEKPLKIHIYNDTEYIIVSNDIQKKNTLETSHKKGLQNLRERTSLTIGKELYISQENNQFTVKLPLVKSI